MKYQMLLFALILCTTGCHVAKQTKATLHGENAMASAKQPPALPPPQMLMHPGPGMDGPGPGVLMPEPVDAMPARSTQVAFVGPASMQVNWDVSAAGYFDSQPLICPGRYNFPQGAIYRLKLTNIPARPGVELYPSMEIGPTLPRTDAYLAHNSIPVQFSEEDFAQVLSGNFVTKVIYLPDPEFQELAIPGVETLVSTRLDPGVDPIVEADRRGAIMAIVRVGNKDLQAGGPAGAEMVVPASFEMPAGGYGGGGPMAMAPSGVPSYISGVSTPQYGMTMSGTPIGLVGPPHLPFGVPAGLQHHSITNHTHMKMPGPTNHFDIHVKQTPGFTYPKPVTQMSVHERVVPYPQRLPAANCPCPPPPGSY